MTSGVGGWSVKKKVEVREGPSSKYIVLAGEEDVKPEVKLRRAPGPEGLRDTPTPGSFLGISNPIVSPSPPR